MLLSDLPDVLTVEEAAAVLRIGRNAAYELTHRWRCTGGREGLPVIQLGRQLRVPRAALERLLAGEATSDECVDPVEDRPLSEGRTRQVIDRWRRAGLVNQRRFFLGSEPVVWPTSEGLRLVLDGYRSRTPALSMLAHIHAVSLVRFGLERRGEAKGWVPERALYRARPSADVHVADGEYTDQAGRRTAVEVELTVKAADRLRRIIGDLTLEYDRVLYVTGDGKVRAAVRTAVHTLGEADRVELAVLASFALPRDGS